MSSSPVTRFEAFSVEHFVLIGAFLVVCVVLMALGRAHRGTLAEVRFRRAYALLIPCFTVPMQVLQLLPEGFDFAKSLPLQLCDFAWIATVVALWTRHWAATALVYFWGLTLTIQGIITPSLTELFPHPQYFMFWGMHFFTVWAAIYLTFGLGVRPTWRSYRFAVVATAAWAVSVMTFNAFTGTNYGYLNRKPAVGTLLDLFGPWPGYVAVEIALVAGIWALMAWPWTRGARHSRGGHHAPRTVENTLIGHMPATARKGNGPVSHRGQALIGHRARPDGLRRRLSVTAVVLATSVATAGCGSEASDTAEPAASTKVSPTSEAKEQVNAAGLAALIVEHLGSNNVAGFGHYGGAPGQVDVVVQLRGRNRADMFVVTVYSPERGQEYAEMATCPTRTQRERDQDTKEFRCHKLSNDTTVTAYLVPYGLSDDNKNGHVVSGLASSPDNSAAMVMYESYDKAAPITVSDIDKLLSDPRLTWMTDPAVNAAGSGLTVERLGG